MDGDRDLLAAFTAHEDDVAPTLIIVNDSSNVSPTLTHPGRVGTLITSPRLPAARFVDDAVSDYVKHARGTHGGTIHTLIAHLRARRMLDGYNNSAIVCIVRCGRAAGSAGSPAPSPSTQTAYRPSAHAGAMSASRLSPTIHVVSGCAPSASSA